MVVVTPRGFEPPTLGLGIRCSILLSYGAMAIANTKRCPEMPVFLQRIQFIFANDTYAIF